MTAEVNVKTTTTWEARGSGALTVAVLADVLSEWPGEVFISRMEVGDSQRDGSWWFITGRVSS